MNKNKSHILSNIASEAFYMYSYIPPAPAVYEKPREPSIFIKFVFLILSVLIVIVTSIIVFTYTWIENIEVYLLSFIAPLLYLQLIWRRDKYEPEPFFYVALAVALGAFSVIPALIVELILDVDTLFSVAIVAPLTEEFFKGIPVFWLARKREFNDSMDGIVYGFASGVGFASLENFSYIVYVYRKAIIPSLLRAFLFSIGHGIYTSITGYAVGRSKEKLNEPTLAYFIGGYIVASLWHALYNGTIVMSFLYTKSVTLTLLPSIAVDFLALTVLLMLIKGALRREENWGYDKGLAPK
ncbi:MAG: hypothetical protein DRJ32_05660 [Thermoprotei archaeon]|nr:MAG: hypothetical protein DRJ32_05660 [Thermoprotei archaeon]